MSNLYQLNQQIHTETQRVTKKQDEYYTPKYAIEPILKKIKYNFLIRPVQGFIIWCPFDTEDSLIVKMFKEAGFRVIATHISNGQDFFTMEVPKCHFIVSTPPYSKKNEVFERLFEIGKPFAMLVGVVGLFESQKRFEMFRYNKFEIMYLNRRVSYFQDYKDEKPKLNPPFSSVWLCSGILENQIEFEKINKNINK